MMLGTTFGPIGRRGFLGAAAGLAALAAIAGAPGLAEA